MMAHDSRRFAMPVVLLAAAGAFAVQPHVVTTFRDDFRGYADERALFERWEPRDGGWHASEGVLETEGMSASALVYAPEVVESDVVELRAALRVVRRTRTGGWALAGVSLYRDASNFWRLALVEGPDGKRYAELSEMLDAKWQAQSVEGTALPSLAKTGGYRGWKDGHTYYLRLATDAAGISGEIREQPDGEVVTRLAYGWGRGAAVRSGRPALYADGLTAQCASIEVRQPVDAAAGGAAARRVAILARDVPVVTPGLVVELTRVFREAGYEPVALGCAELVDGRALDPRRVGTLVLPNSPYFPAAGTGALLRFLRGGGNLVLLGGQAFRHALYPVGDRWLTLEALEASVSDTPVSTTLFDFEDANLKLWRRGTNAPEHPSSFAIEPGNAPRGRSLHLSIKALTGWDTLSAAVPRAIPAEDNLFHFDVRGDAGTPRVVVELDEADGSRWIAVVEVTKVWQHHAMPAWRFKYWRDSSTSERGGDGDCVRLGNVKRVSFGLAVSHTPELSGDHELWVDKVGVSRAFLPDSLYGELPELNAFSDYAAYDLGAAAAATASAGQELLPGDFAMEVPFSGTAAVGFAFPNESAYHPLLDARDANGRNAGAVLGLLVNYGGAYRGSSWLLCGVTTPEFYAHPSMSEAVAKIAATLATRELPREERRANIEAARAPLPLTTPAPHSGFIHRGSDGRHLVYPDGRRFFMLGCNYVGGFVRCGGRAWREATFDPRVVEDDFRKARDAGLNVMRYWLQGSFETALRAGDRRQADMIRECARRYGVYLLLDLPGTSCASTEQMAASHRAIAEAFRDEPMVIGYDLRNEPYVTTIGGIRYADPQPAILEPDLRRRYADTLDLAKIDGWVTERPWWLHLPGDVKGGAARNLVAAWLLWNDYMTTHRLRSSTLTGLAAEPPRDPARQPLLDSLDAVLARWLRIQIDAIRSVDTNHLITVGYNTALTMLPANAALDFVSHHVYQRPYSYEDVMENLTALDRLAARWPDRPITFGEFGYSNGIRMNDGYLDADSSSLGELVHYLYALAHGYDGAKKWMLVDWPLAVMRHYGDWDRGLETRIYEERFGLYTYDGSLGGRPKPIAYALRFLRDCLDRGSVWNGKLTVTPGATRIGTVYRFEAPRALFVGDTAYEGPRLSFKADRATNVMLTWTDDELRLMSTADARVSLRPAEFIGGATDSAVVINGNTAGHRDDGERLQVTLLAGEMVTVLRPRHR